MRKTRANLRILAAAGCAAWVAFGPVSAARADDPDTVRARLVPRDAPAGAPWVQRAAAAPAWIPDDALEREREREAASVGQAYVADHLDTWLEDTPLEVVGRLRHTDLVIAGGERADGAAGAPAAAPAGLGVRVRLAEKVRLTVVRDDFRRDLLYDPIRGRMSMDLFRSTVGSPATGVALTESYRVDDGSSRLLLNLHHRLE